LLVVVFGPSGSGKTTIVREMVKDKRVGEIVSTTSRPKRKNEKEGKDYYFVSFEEAQRLLAEGQFVEHTIYDGHIYGITKQEIDAKLQNYPLAAVVTDITGLKQLELQYRDKIFKVHIGADPAHLIQRLLNRGDAVEDVVRRLRTVEKELANWVYADVVFNSSRHRSKEIAEQIKKVAGLP
jgi:guanylate kinase